MTRTRSLRALAILASLIIGATIARAQVSPIPSHGSGTVHPSIRILPGAVRSDGFTRMAHLSIDALRDGDYVGHCLLVKTRFHYLPTKDATTFPSDDITRVLDDYGVAGIRLPFPQFARAVELSADRYGLGRLFEVRFDADVTPMEICRRLEALPDVEYAEPLLVRHIEGTPNDPMYAQQSDLVKIHAEQAWAITTGDTNVTIAVVDDGEDIDHEDLAGHIWKNPAEIPDNGIDDDNNGFIDDVNGWDFVGDPDLTQVLNDEFFPDNDPRPNGNTHGTHVSGTAGAVTDNGVGVAALSYHCRLIPIKIGSSQAPSILFRGYEAIMYAAELGADIINCSWGGGGYSQAEQDVINQVTDMGSLVVAASGNNGKDIDVFETYPAKYRNVLTVGASDSNDLTPYFSNYGVLTDVYAPGVDILSTVPGGYESDGWMGTSMACPHVSSLAALVKTMHPDWSPLQIARQIRVTCDDVMTGGDPARRPKAFGRINAERALTVNAGSHLDAPGIHIVDAAVDAPDGLIQNFDATSARVTLRNELGTAKNVAVTVTPLSSGISVEGGATSFDSLATAATHQIDFQVRISEDNAYYEGVATVLVTTTADGYVDYDLVPIPFKLETSNQYHVVMQDEIGLQALCGYSPDPNSLFVSMGLQGLGGLVFRFVDTNYDYNYVGLDPVNVITARDLDHAWAGSTSSDGLGATINQTEDGGLLWWPIPVTSMSSVAGINFYSNTSGVAIGNPFGSSWGVATTSDAGQSWMDAAGPTAASAAANVDPNAVAFLGDSIWFGTSDGVVFRSGDRGATWQQATANASDAITHLAFASDRIGVAVVRDASDSSAPHRVIRTTDGGVTWSGDVLDLSATDFVPVHLSAPPGLDRFFMIATDGRVLNSTDDGATWSNIPTLLTSDEVSAGATVVGDSTIKLWNLSGTIGYLEVPIEHATVSVSQQQSSAAELSAELSPNPARGILSVRIDGASRAETQLTLLDPLGRTVPVESDRQGPGRYRLNVAGLAAGVYFVRIRSGAAVVIKRVVVIR